MHLIYTWIELLNMGCRWYKWLQVAVRFVFTNTGSFIICLYKKQDTLKRIRISLDSAVLLASEVWDLNKAGPYSKGAEQLHPLYK